MPFKVQIFLENVDCYTEGQSREKLRQECELYSTLTTPIQKTHCIQRLMEILDRGVEEGERKKIMQACGRRCITASTLARARRLKHIAQNVDDLLGQLNEAYIGGGHLRREGALIHAAYDRCYCGSVSQAKERFSPNLLPVLVRLVQTAV